MYRLHHPLRVEIRFSDCVLNTPAGKGFAVDKISETAKGLVVCRWKGDPKSELKIEKHIFESNFRADK